MSIDRLSNIFALAYANPVEMAQPNTEADRLWQEYAVATALLSMVEKRKEAAKKAVIDRVTTDIGKHIVRDSRYVFVETNNIEVAKPINIDLLTSALIKAGLSVTKVADVLLQSRPPKAMQQRITATLK
jgi:hypothetical protein